jgi:hypothetical protein
MITKNIIKRLSFLALILSVLFILGACSKNDKENQSDKNLTPIEQFNLSVKASDPDPEKFEAIFGKGSSWEMIGSPIGSESSNEYEFRLKLPKVEPMEQASFDELKVKATPFTNKLLEEMKKVGIKNPVVNLKILDENKNEFKGSKGLKTTYRLTLEK